MRDLAKDALDRLREESSANRRHAIRHARDEPAPLDVAIHPESDRFHDPDQVDGAALGYVSESAARRAGFERCPHCAPSGRRTVIRGPGGGR